MKCEICGKEILKDSQCINYKYYHNDCIENLEKQNKQLKDKIPYIIQNNSCKYISIEKCKNKVCVNYKMQELQESDSNVKEKDFFKTCFNAVAGLEVKNKSQAIAKEVILSEIENLQEENKKQKEVINKAVLELVNIDGTLSNGQLSDRICNLIDILNEVLE